MSSIRVQRTPDFTSVWFGKRVWWDLVLVHKYLDHIAFSWFQHRQTMLHLEGEAEMITLASLHNGKKFSPGFF